MSKARDTPLSFVSILWLGCLLGVSFLATPVKFQAPSLDLPTALEVGRVTFALFMRVEWVLCAALVLATALSRRPGILCWSAVALLCLILLVETFWLLPILDERVGRIIAGDPAPASAHHIFYIAADCGKAVILLGLSVQALRMLAAQETR